MHQVRQVRQWLKITDLVVAHIQIGQVGQVFQAGQTGDIVARQIQPCQRLQPSCVREVAVPNLTQPQLQQVGIRLCGDTLHARVLLRSGGQTTESQPVSLVEDRN